MWPFIRLVAAVNCFFLTIWPGPFWLQSLSGLLAILWLALALFRHDGRHDKRARIGYDARMAKAQAQPKADEWVDKKTAMRMLARRP